MHSRSPDPLPRRRALLAAVMLCCAALARAGIDDPDRPYAARADARAGIESLLADRASGKRILLVFGGNWCSDSRSLARRFQVPALAGLLAREFRVLHVDVGMFHRNLDIAEQYGNPIDKGIPSVALLAPDGSLLHADHGSLASAARMSDPDILAFFERLAADHPAS